MKLNIQILATLMLGLSSLSHAADRLTFRAGYTYLDLQTTSSEVVITGVDNVGSLAITEGPVAGSGVSVKGGGRPSVVINYRLNEHWSAETIVAPPFEFAMEFEGTIRDQSVAPNLISAIPSAIDAFGGELGSVKSLPVVGSVIYHFTNQGVHRPYIGAGLTYIFTFDPEITNRVLTGNGNPSLEVGSSFGGVVQVGNTMHVNENLAINLDLKYVTGAKLGGDLTDITLSSPAVQDIFRSATAKSAKVEIEASALVFNISARVRFK